MFDLSHLHNALGSIILRYHHVKKHPGTAFSSDTVTDYMAQDIENLVPDLEQIIEEAIDADSGMIANRRRSLLNLLLDVIRDLNPIIREQTPLTPEAQEGLTTRLTGVFVSLRDLLKKGTGDTMTITYGEAGEAHEVYGLDGGYWDKALCESGTLIHETLFIGLVLRDDATEEEIGERLSSIITHTQQGYVQATLAASIDALRAFKEAAETEIAQSKVALENAAAKIAKLETETPPSPPIPADKKILVRRLTELASEIALLKRELEAAQALTSRQESVIEELRQALGRASAKRGESGAAAPAVSVSKLSRLGRFARFSGGELGTGLRTGSDRHHPDWPAGKQPLVTEEDRPVEHHGFMSFLVKPLVDFFDEEEEDGNGEDASASGHISMRS